jgi:hypothetical protein
MGKRIDIPPEEYLRGLDGVVEHLQACVDNMECGSAKGLTNALMYVAEESQQRAPIDTGDLRGSVRVELDGQAYAEGEKGGGVNVLGAVPETAEKGSVSFNTPYAADQHEHEEYDHPREGRAKYLESVLVEQSERILQTIARGVIDELFGGGADD